MTIISAVRKINIPVFSSHHKRSLVGILNQMEPETKNKCCKLNIISKIKKCIFKMV